MDIHWYTRETWALCRLLFRRIKACDSIWFIQFERHINAHYTKWITWKHFNTTVPMQQSIRSRKQLRRMLHILHSNCHFDFVCQMPILFAHKFTCTAWVNLKCDFLLLLLVHNGIRRHLLLWHFNPKINASYYDGRTHVCTEVTKISSKTVIHTILLNIMTYTCKSNRLLSIITQNCSEQKYAHTNLKSIKKANKH